MVNASYLKHMGIQNQNMPESLLTAFFWNQYVFPNGQLFQDYIS